MKPLLIVLTLFPVMASAQGASSPAARSAADEGQKFGALCAYPDAALRAGAVGESMISFRIADDGQITDVKVVRSSGNADLDSAAAQCVGTWRVDPSTARKTRIRSGTIAWTVPSASPGASALSPGGRFRYGGRANCAANWYPPEDVKAGVEGTAGVLLHITADGAVKDPEIAISSGHPELDRAALGCVMQWHFRPAMLNGSPIAVNRFYEVQWTLNPDVPTSEAPALGD